MVTVLTKFGLGHVVVAGLFGGLLFAAFEMMTAAIMAGPAGFFMPLRMIGAMIIGPGALDPGATMAVAALAGLIVHLLLSIGFAFLFARIVPPDATAGTLALGGIVFGTLLWLVNFYVFAPLAGWTWFPEQTSAPVQFVAHAFFFGCPVGWYLGRSRIIEVRR